MGICSSSPLASNSRVQHKQQKRRLAVKGRPRSTSRPKTPLHIHSGIGEGKRTSSRDARPQSGQKASRGSASHRHSASYEATGGGPDDTEPPLLATTSSAHRNPLDAKHRHDGAPHNNGRNSSSRDEAPQGLLGAADGDIPMLNVLTACGETTTASSTRRRAPGLATTRNESAVDSKPPAPPADVSKSTAPQMFVPRGDLDFAEMETEGGCNNMSFGHSLSGSVKPPLLSTTPEYPQANVSPFVGDDLLFVAEMPSTRTLDGGADDSYASRHQLLLEEDTTSTAAVLDGAAALTSATSYMIPPAIAIVDDFNGIASAVDAALVLPPHHSLQQQPQQQHRGSTSGAANQSSFLVAARTISSNPTNSVNGCGGVLSPPAPSNHTPTGNSAGNSPDVRTPTNRQQQLVQSNQNGKSGGVRGGPRRTSRERAASHSIASAMKRNAAASTSVNGTVSGIGDISINLSTSRGATGGAVATSALPPLRTLPSDPLSDKERLRINAWMDTIDCGLTRCGALHDPQDTGVFAERSFVCTELLKELLGQQVAPSQAECIIPPQTSPHPHQ